MAESGYYPPGAENDPRAPYNQAEPDECPDCLGEGTLYIQDGTPIEDCRRCDGTGYVDPPTREEIRATREEINAERQLDER